MITENLPPSASFSRVEDILHELRMATLSALITVGGVVLFLFRPLP